MAILAIIEFPSIPMIKARQRSCVLVECMLTDGCCSGCVLLVFLNDITRNIIPSNGTETLLVYYGYIFHLQEHGYTIVAFHPRVFQGYLICLIPWEDYNRENQANIYMLLVIIKV